MTNLAYPLAAIRADGLTILACTPEEAADFYMLNPATHHVDACVDYQGHLRRYHNTWIVRDDHGRVVERHDLPERPRPRTGWHYGRIAKAQAAADRGLPIPNLRRRGLYRQGFRHFATNIAMRAADSALEDDLAEWGVEHARAGRCRENVLPQMRDDVAWRDKRRCWKDYRANQWR